MAAHHGAFIDDVWKFDNKFFNITPREAKSMDPQQRILLHTAQAALDDAGYVRDSTPTFQRATMGCYVGLATGDYTDNLRDDIDLYYSPGESALLTDNLTADIKRAHCAHFTAEGSRSYMVSAVPQLLPIPHALLALSRYIRPAGH